MWELEYLNANNEWAKVFLTVNGHTYPVRYEGKADAEICLSRLWPHLPDYCKRVVRSAPINECVCRVELHSLNPLLDWCTS